jgi:hypothetical protein
MRIAEIRRWDIFFGRPPRGQLRQPAQDILRMPWVPGPPLSGGRAAATPPLTPSRLILLFRKRHFANCGLIKIPFKTHIVLVKTGEIEYYF